MKSKAMCAGCYNNDYNNGLGGAKECFYYREAKMIQRIPIHINEAPPYKKEFSRLMMSCYRQPQMVFVEPKNLDSRGYWR